MEIIKEDNVIVLYNNFDKIEEYDFKKTVNLAGLIKFLLNDNLVNKFDIVDKLGEKTQEEENLIEVILELLKDYNSKVEEYSKFRVEEIDNGSSVQSNN